MGIVGLVLLGLIVLIGLWMLSSYNGLVAMRQRCKQSFADIDVQLKQRQDLVPNLVETVKGYATHERETLENVVKWRNAAAGATTQGDKAAAEGQLTTALRQLMVVAEAYPDLKANQGFQQLQAELADLENKIAAARRFFNNSAAEYNASRESFPAVLIANNFGFGPQEFFNLDEAERKTASAAPQVKF